MQKTFHDNILGMLSTGYNQNCKLGTLLTFTLATHLYTIGTHILYHRGIYVDRMPPEITQEYQMSF